MNKMTLILWAGLLGCYDDATLQFRDYPSDDYAVEDATPADDADVDAAPAELGVLEQGLTMPSGTGYGIIPGTNGSVCPVPLPQSGAASCEVPRVKRLLACADSSVSALWKQRINDGVLYFNNGSVAGGGTSGTGFTAGVGCNATSSDLKVTFQLQVLQPGQGTSLGTTFGGFSVPNCCKNHVRDDGESDTTVVRLQTFANATTKIFDPASSGINNATAIAAVAHELGHAAGLPHKNVSGNLMHINGGANTTLDSTQRSLMRTFQP